MDQLSTVTFLAAMLPAFGAAGVPMKHGQVHLVWSDGARALAVSGGGMAAGGPSGLSLRIGGAHAQAKVAADAPGVGRADGQALLQGHAKDSAQQRGENDEARMKFDPRWLSFWYWKPLMCFTLWLILMVDVVGGLVDKFVTFSLVSEIALLCVTMYGLAFVTFLTLNMKAAGHMVLVIVVTLGSTICLVAWLGVVGLKVARKSDKDPVVVLCTDVALLIRPFLRLLVVLVLLDVIAREASVDWGQLALLLGYATLGIALALAGVIGDIIAHVFIRLDDHFKEGDFIVYNGTLVQISAIGWRHTQGITDATNSLIYIPNSELTMGSVVNQSQDNDRSTEVDIPFKLDADKMEIAVENAWKLMLQTGEEGFTFTGLDGKVYQNQFNTEECQIWLKENCDALHINFVAKNFFSNPPPWEGEEGKEPESNQRQREWEWAWQMQLEWYNLNLKRENEKLGEWPRIRGWQPPI